MIPVIPVLSSRALVIPVTINPMLSFHRTSFFRPGGTLIARAAKDKKGSKKGVSALAGLMKKKAEAEESQSLQPKERATPAQYRDPEVRGLLFALATSYFKATKKFLIDGIDLEQLPDAIYHASFCCLAHNRFQEGVTDPLFIYGNKAGLDLFEANWDQLIGIPSRLSAADDPNVQQERQQLLDAAAESKLGVINNYEGWRVSQSGKRFKIKGVTLFNIVDFTGDKIGQAAVFDQYELEDGTLVRVTSEAWQPAQIELPPSSEDIVSAEAAVEEQAAAVRNLKEGQGRTNLDPEVQSAVVELKTRKDRVVDMRRRAAEALAQAEAAFDDDE